MHSNGICGNILNLNILENLKTSEIFLSLNIFETFKVQVSGEWSDTVTQSNVIFDFNLHLFYCKN
jgi:hypothetical protein